MVMPGRVNDIQQVKEVVPEILKQVLITAPNQPSPMSKQ
jgi:hypothetical protein